MSCASFCTGIGVELCKFFARELALSCASYLRGRGLVELLVCMRNYVSGICLRAHKLLAYFIRKMCHYMSREYASEYKAACLFCKKNVSHECILNSKAVGMLSGLT